MRRFFVKNLLFVIAVNVLVKPVWVIFIDRTVQNKVGAAAYGNYSALLTMSIIFSILLDFGITNYNTRIISQNADRLPELFPSMLSARLLLIVAYVVTVCLAGFIAGYRGYDFMLLLGVMMIQALSSLVLFIRSNVSALQHFKTDGLLSVSDRFLMILVCGLLFAYPATGTHFKIEWFVLAQIGCYAAACVVAIIVLKRVHPLKMTLSFHPGDIVRVMRDSLPYALLIFLMSLYIRADMTLVERLSGPTGKTEAGIYAASYRWLDISVNMVGGMFAAILLPLFGKMLAEKQDVNPIITLCVNIMLPVSFMVSVAAIFFGTPIMHALYHDATSYYALIFAWVMGAFPAFSLMYVYSTLLTANGNIKVLVILSAIGALVNISINAILIPRYHAYSAAILCCTTETLMAAGNIFFCSRILKVHMPAKWVVQHLGYLTLIVAVAWGVSHIHVGWVGQLLAFAGTGMALVFLFRFVSISGLKKLFERKLSAAH
jgi:O-antigen/teichoic acid export membrane protein